MQASHDTGPAGAKWIPVFGHHAVNPNGMNGGVANFVGGPANWEINNGEPEMYARDGAGWSFVSHEVTGGCLLLRAKRYSALSAGDQAKVCLMGIYSPAAKARYVSACVSTEGWFAQKFGIFSSRDRMPWFTGTWPAWWLFENTNQNELDIEEYGLGGTGQEQQSTSALHWSFYAGNQNYGQNLGYDLSKDFHDRTVKWTSDHVEKYLDGELVETMVPSAPGAFNQYAMHLRYNLAILPAVDADATLRGLLETDLDAGKGLMEIDRTTVMQFA